MKYHIYPLKNSCKNTNNKVDFVGNSVVTCLMAMKNKEIHIINTNNYINSLSLITKKTIAYVYNYKTSIRII